MREASEKIQLEMTLMARYRYMGLAPQPRLDRSAFLVLSRIEAEGALSIGQLAEGLGLETSTLNRQTAAMTRAALLERIPDPEGGIARKFRATEEGLAKLRADREDAVRGLEAVLADWKPEEAAAFATALERFNSSIEALIGHEWPRG